MFTKIEHRQKVQRCLCEATYSIQYSKHLPTILLKNIYLLEIVQLYTVKNHATADALLNLLKTLNCKFEETSATRVLVINPWTKKKSVFRLYYDKNTWTNRKLRIFYANHFFCERMTEQNILFLIFLGVFLIHKTELLTFNKKQRKSNKPCGILESWKNATFIIALQKTAILP